MLNYFLGVFRWLNNEQRENEFIWVWVFLFFLGLYLFRWVLGELLNYAELFFLFERFFRL